MRRKFKVGQIVREAVFSGSTPMWTNPPHLWIVGKGMNAKPISECTSPWIIQSKPMEDECLFEPIDPLLEAVIRANLKEGM